MTLLLPGVALDGQARVRMEDRGDLSDVWGDDEEDEAQQGGDILGDFERMQRAQVETIANAAAQPARQPAREGAFAPGLAPTISLEERYAVTYNRHMNEVRVQWPDSDSELEEEGARRDDEGDNSTSSSDSEAPPRAPRAPRAPRPGGDSDDEPSTASPPPSPRRRPGRPERPEREERRGGDRPEYDTRTRGECYLCAKGNATRDAIDAPHLNQMNVIVRECLGVRADREVAQMLHDYYKKVVWRRGMRMLTKEVALEHLEGLHTNNARMWLNRMILDEKMTYYNFKNVVWRADGTWDKAAQKECRESKKEMRLLYQLPLHRLNFAEGQSVEDQKRQANYFNVLSRFEHTGTGGAVETQRATTPFRL